MCTERKGRLLVVLVVRDVYVKTKWWSEYSKFMYLFYPKIFYQTKPKLSIPQPMLGLPEELRTTHSGWETFNSAGKELH